MFIPLLAGIDIAGKTITTDALLTQREAARYLIAERGAHYLFIVKDNQSNLLADLCLFFAQRGAPDFCEPVTLEHGRLESRRIWTTTALNDYLDFPYVGQAFLIERLRIDKKTAKESGAALLKRRSASKNLVVRPAIPAGLPTQPNPLRNGALARSGKTGFCAIVAAFSR